MYIIPADNLSRWNTPLTVPHPGQSHLIFEKMQLLCLGKKLQAQFIEHAL